MKRTLVIALAAVALTVALGTDRQVQADGGYWERTSADRWAANHAVWRPWHGPYNNEVYGRPLAVVLPPTVTAQTNWAWGVGRTRVTPMYHQFRRCYPGPYAGNPGVLYNTPDQPSSTTQFGAYYIRAPW